MIALPAFHVTTLRVVQTRLPHGLAEDLTLYRMFYKQTYGAEVSEADLMREILRAFIEGDETFRQFKRVARGCNRSKRLRQANLMPNASSKDSAVHDVAAPPGAP